MYSSPTLVARKEKTLVSPIFQKLSSTATAKIKWPETDRTPIETDA